MQRKSVYKYSSEAGLPVGLYLSMMSFFFLLSVKLPVLSSLILPLSLGFPFFLAWQVRKIGKAEPSYMKFSPLWLAGIYSVIFGTMICMLLTALYLTFVDPGFIVSYCTSMIETVSSSPYSEQFGETIAMMQAAIDNRLLPTPMDFAISMGWTTCFAGSVISLFIAMILSKAETKLHKAVSR